MSVLITLPLWWQFRTFNLFVAAFVIPAVLLSVSALVPV